MLVAYCLFSPIRVCYRSQIFIIFTEHTKQCRAHRRFLINVCWMTESTNLSPVGISGEISSVLWVRSLHILNSHDSFYRGGKLLHFVQPLHFNLPVMTCACNRLFCILIFLCFWHFIPPSLLPELILLTLTTQKR